MAVVALSDRPAIVDELVLQTGGYPEEELDRMVQLESEWDPAAQQPVTKASGLIQIMPNHLKRWGITPAEVQAMTAWEQTPLVGRYFREANAFGRWSTPGDTYLAIAAPSFLGRPNSAVAFPVGSRAWQANPAWRSAGNGDITVGSIREVLLRGLPGHPRPRKRKPGGIIHQEEPYYPVYPRTTAPKPVPWGWIVAAILLGVASRKSRRRG